MNKLSRLAFKGYKNFSHETSLGLGDLNILIGANQSGKSNVMDLFELLHQASQKKLQTAISARGGIDNLLSWNDASSMIIQLSITEKSKREIDYKLELVDSFHRARIQSEKFEDMEIHSDSFLKAMSKDSINFDESELSIAQVKKMGRADDKDGRRHSIFFSLLSRIATYPSFNTDPKSPIRNPDFIGTQISGLPPTRLAPNGDNLTSVLYLMAHEPKYRDTLEEYEFTLNRAFPTFKRLTFPPISQGKTIVSWEDERTARAIPATFLSDGTLRFMCLVAALYDPEPPSILCIDEPETGLHPDMLRLLAAVIRKASSQMQILISTHSADLLTYLESPDCIIVCESEGTHSSLKKLNGNDLKDWLNAYTIGELWKSGEIGGRP